ncbi:nickel ABC transporter substrate-binding protein [Longirhabdus pacifica]|uniref:nickel ABC transporter substrate-binding protein n=1 Tax=Longirhabdus pacifica TaxID=2305227 RepID=UPI00352194C2
MKSKCMMLIMVLSFVLVACSSHDNEETNTGGESENKEITFLSNFPFETMDPHLNWTPMRAGVVETLVKITEDYNIEPWLASEWETKDNGQTWTFKITENVTFQNGKTLDAEAVKASFERNIQNSAKMKAALSIESMEAEGQKLTFRLEKALPQFPSELVHPNASIIDVTEENMETAPIGTGPFQVATFEAGTKLELNRYDDYWGGKPKLNKVTFTYNEDANARTAALQSGDADIVYRPAIESLELLKQDKSIATEVVPSTRTTMLMFNMNVETTQDENIRRALEALIHREEVVSSVMAGQAEVSQGPFLADAPFSPSYEEKEFGEEIAKEYLQTAGFVMENGKALKDGNPLELTLVTYNYRPDLPIVAQILESNAKELGITMDIQIVENIDEYLKTKDDWDLAIYSANTAPRGDAGYFLNAVYMENGALNFGEVRDQNLVNVIHEFNGTAEIEKRNELAKEAVTIIDENRYHSFVVHPSNYAAYKNTVKNYQISKSEFYVITKDIDIGE